VEAGTMRRKLYRNSEDAICCGVCAGIADYFDWDVWLVRIVALSLLVFTNSFAFFLYICGWICLKDNPDIPRNRARLNKRFENLKQSFARTGVVDDIGRRFERTEKRLRRLEAHVTSPEFKLRHEFDNL